MLCALYFGTLLIGRQRLPTSDFSGQFHAFALFQAQEMAQGHLPTWSPGSYGGTPFAADVQSAVFYPPRWLTVLLSLPRGFSYYALELEGIAHIWLAGVFTYALAFALTGEMLAGLAGATAFALGGYLTSYPLLQLAILETVTWLPLTLLLLREGGGRRTPVPWLVGAGMALALSALAGHPQTFLHVAYLAAAYYLYTAVRARWRWQAVLGLGALVAVVAIGLSAAAWVPAARFMLRTVRNNVNYDFVASGLPMLDYVQALVPGVISLWSPQYVGIAATAWAVLAWLGRRRDQGEIAFWAWAAFLAAWLALGDAGILFQWVYRFVPGFALFRQQERLLGLFSLSIALLAAQGVAVWLRADVASRRELVRRTGGVLLGGLLLCGLILAMASRGSDRQWLGVWLRQWPVLALVLALLWGGRWQRQRAALAVALLGLDLYISTWGGMRRQPGPPDVFWPRPAWVEALRTASPSRMDSQRLFYANIGEVYGLEDIWGLSPLRPKVLDDLNALPIARRWQLLNVVYIVSNSPPAGVPLTRLGEVDDLLVPDAPLHAVLFRFDAALPRAWLVPRARRLPDAAAALRALADPAFDPRAEVLLHSDMPDAEKAPSGRAGQVQTTRLGPGALQMRVTSETGGFLVISEWFYPGWRATLDGQRAQLYPANYAFQTLWLPAGEHEVMLRFAPVDVPLGVGVSLATLLAAVLLVWRWRPAISGPDEVGAGVPTAAPVALAPAWTGPARASALWLCVLLTLLGFALRAFRLGAQELRGDEAFSYLVALHPLTRIVPELLRMGEANPPLHFLMLHVGMRLAGSSEFSLRFISLLPGVLLVPVMFQLGRRLGGGGLGALLAGLAALSSSLVWMAQDARNQYTLAMLFGALATLALLRALERSTWGAWGLYAASCALTVYGHYYGIFALLAHAVAALAVPTWRSRWMPWLISTLAAAGAFLPWFAATWPKVWGTGQFQSSGSPELARYLTDFGVELATGASLGSPVARWLFLAALGLGLVGAREIWRRERGSAVLLIAWLGGAALMIYLIRFTREMFNTFYILVAAPAWWTLVGAGLFSLWRRAARWQRILASLALVALVVGNGVSLGRYYGDPAYSRTNGYRGLAAYVAARAEPGDVLLRHFPDPCLDYYFEAIPIPRVMQPATASASTADTERGLAELAARYRRLWFVPYHRSNWDPQDVAYRWLDANNLLEQEASSGRLSVLAYRPLHALEGILMPLHMPLGERLRLEGAFVTVDGRPVDLRASPLALPPGSVLRVSLLWQALDKVPRGYTVFVHVTDSAGKLLAQHDGWPAQGMRPTWTWAPGEAVLDRHEVRVPAEMAGGAGTIWVGMYDSETVKRLTFAGGQDALRLAAISLTPR